MRERESREEGDPRVRIEAGERILESVRQREEVHEREKAKQGSFFLCKVSYIWPIAENDTLQYS